VSSIFRLPMAPSQPRLASSVNSWEINRFGMKRNAVAECC
jgi:hypothetical protein